jgi:hypothetical protein
MFAIMSEYNEPCLMMVFGGWSVYHCVYMLASAFFSSSYKVSDISSLCWFEAQRQTTRPFLSEPKSIGDEDFR